MADNGSVGGATRGVHKRAKIWYYLMLGLVVLSFFVLVFTPVYLLRRKRKKEEVRDNDYIQEAPEVPWHMEEEIKKEIAANKARARRARQKKNKLAITNSRDKLDKLDNEKDNRERNKNSS